MDAGNLYQYLLPFDELEEAESLKIQLHNVDGVRQRHPIEFSFWIDKSIAKSELSKHWLPHTIKGEESYLDEQGMQRHRVLVQAEEYSKRHILQQLLKY